MKRVVSALLFSLLAVVVSLLPGAGALAQTGGATDLIQLSVQYPKLNGVTGEAFTFDMVIKNLDDVAHNCDLAVAVPENWDYSINPRYDSSKQISTVRVEPDLDTRLDVVITPPTEGADLGEYPIVITAVSGTIKATVDLAAVVISSYVLTINPVVVITSGEETVVKASATIGKENIFALDVGNYGTSDVTGITFTTEKPEGWSVEASPNTITAIKAGDHKLVDLVITPAAGAKPGDRYITLRAIGKETAASLDIRVEARRPNIWGWVALGVAVVGAAGLVFWRHARRKAKPA